MDEDYYARLRDYYSKESANRSKVLRKGEASRAAYSGFSYSDKCLTIANNEPEFTRHGVHSKEQSHKNTGVKPISQLDLDIGDTNLVITGAHKVDVHDPKLWEDMEIRSSKAYHNPIREGLGGQQRDLEKGEFVQPNSANPEDLYVKNDEGEEFQGGSFQSIPFSQLSEAASAPMVSDLDVRKFDVPSKMMVIYDIGGPSDTEFNQGSHILGFTVPPTTMSTSDQQREQCIVSDNFQFDIVTSKPPIYQQANTLLDNISELRPVRKSKSAQLSTDSKQVSTNSAQVSTFEEPPSYGDVIESDLSLKPYLTSTDPPNSPIIEVTSSRQKVKQFNRSEVINNSDYNQIGGNINRGSIISSGFADKVTDKKKTLHIRGHGPTLIAKNSKTQRSKPSFKYDGGQQYKQSSLISGSYHRYPAVSMESDSTDSEEEASKSFGDYVVENTDVGSGLPLPFFITRRAEAVPKRKPHRKRSAAGQNITVKGHSHLRRTVSADNVKIRPSTSHQNSLWEDFLDGGSKKTLGSETSQNQDNKDITQIQGNGADEMSVDGSIDEVAIEILNEEDYEKILEDTLEKVEPQNERDSKESSPEDSVTQEKVNFEKLLDETLEEYDIISSTEYKDTRDDTPEKLIVYTSTPNKLDKNKNTEDTQSKASDFEDDFTFSIIESPIKLDNDLRDNRTKEPIGVADVVERYNDDKEDRTPIKSPSSSRRHSKEIKDKTPEPYDIEQPFGTLTVHTPIKLRSVSPEPTKVKKTTDKSKVKSSKKHDKTKDVPKQKTMPVPVSIKFKDSGSQITGISLKIPVEVGPIGTVDVPMPLHIQGKLVDTMSLSDVSDIHDNIGDAIESDGDGERNTAMGTDLETEMDKRTTTVKTEIDESTTVVKTEMSESTTVVKTEMGESTTIVKTEIDESTTVVKTEMDESTTVMQTEMDESTSVKTEMNESTTVVKTEMDERTAVMQTEMDESTSVKTEMNESTTVVKTEMDKSTAVMQTEMDQSTSVKTEINESTTVIETEMDESPTVVKTEIDESTTVIKTEMDESLTVVKTEMDENTAVVKTEMDESPSVMQTEIDESTANNQDNMKIKQEVIQTNVDIGLENTWDIPLQDDLVCTVVGEETATTQNELDLLTCKSDPFRAVAMPRINWEVVEQTLDVNDSMYYEVTHEFNRNEEQMVKYNQDQVEVVVERVNVEDPKQIENILIPAVEEPIQIEETNTSGQHEPDANKDGHSDTQIIIERDNSIGSESSDKLTSDSDGHTVSDNQKSVHGKKQVHTESKESESEDHKDIEADDEMSVDSEDQMVFRYTKQKVEHSVEQVIMEYDDQSEEEPVLVKDKIYGDISSPDQIDVNETEIKDSINEISAEASEASLYDENDDEQSQKDVSPPSWVQPKQIIHQQRFEKYDSMISEKPKVTEQLSSDRTIKVTMTSSYEITDTAIDNGESLRYTKPDAPNGNVTESSSLRDVKILKLRQIDTKTMFDRVKRAPDLAGESEFEILKELYEKVNISDAESSQVLEKLEQEALERVRLLDDDLQKTELIATELGDHTKNVNGEKQKDIVKPKDVDEQQAPHACYHKAALH
ncbi:unnamed protein product [Owenia fusiformis]|uniref:Uncharacterized protein n=1 Tax=Owenia fusiformis TaxID=6347 RepID=A0A8J1XZR2_OWEFU|nr:unnamed protein product [Owenia fusiformis]